MLGILRKFLSETPFFPILKKWKRIFISKSTSKIHFILDGSQTLKKKNLCIVAHFCNSKTLTSSFLLLLEQLNNMDYDVIVVSTAQNLDVQKLQKHSSLFYKFLIKENCGYDFGSWKVGLYELGLNLSEYENLLLTNDSYFGFLPKNLPYLQSFLENSKADILGITDSFEYNYHLQSYFLLFRKNVFQTNIFHSFWENVRFYPNKYKHYIIHDYEIGLSQYFLKKKFKLEAMISQKRFFELEYKRIFQVFDSLNVTPNLTIIFPLDIIRQPLFCPIIKKEIFFINKARVDLSFCDSTLHELGYDIKFIIDYFYQEYRETLLEF